MTPFSSQQRDHKNHLQQISLFTSSLNDIKIHTWERVGIPVSEKRNCLPLLYLGTLGAKRLSLLDSYPNHHRITDTQSQVFSRNPDPQVRWERDEGKAPPG